MERETPEDAFDLQRPEFRKFITDLMVDVARRYDVDGINLDYIRTMGICRCEPCKKTYESLTGRNLIDDIALSPAGGNLEPHLQQWVDQAVASIVRDVSGRVRAIKPGICLSVDGHPQSGPNPEGRREIAWANNGLVDLVYNMDYSDPPDWEGYNLMLSRFDDPSKFMELLSNYSMAGGAPLPADAPTVSRNIDRARRRWGKRRRAVLLHYAQRRAGGPIGR